MLLICYGRVEWGDLSCHDFGRFPLVKSACLVVKLGPGITRFEIRGAENQYLHLPA